MRPEIKVYIASKLEHGPKLAKIRKDGFHINARWIHMADAGRAEMKPVTHWQQENFDDIAAAHVVIFYVEPGDKLKGALMEVGWALCNNKNVWIAGDGSGVEVTKPEGSWRIPHKDIEPWCHYRQQIRVAISLDQAFDEIDALINQGPLKMSDGTETARKTFWDRIVKRAG